MITVKVPARICLLGDHQDYLGLPVVAASIDRYLTLEARPQKKACFTFELIDLCQTRELALQIDESSVQNGDFLAATLAVLARKGVIAHRGYRIKIHSSIPVNAGVSSSSALVIAFIRFLIGAFSDKQIDDRQVADWANEAEVDFFGDPGGLMDHYSIALEELRVIYPDSRTTEVLSRPKHFPLILVESGIAKQTVGVLSKAKEKALEALTHVQTKNHKLNYHNAQMRDILAHKNQLSPELFSFWQASIANHHITKSAIELLSEPATHDLMPKLAELINQHQFYLQTAIQNTPELMQRQMQVALRAGGLATKVIGSGGGGCFFVLAEPEAAPLIIGELVQQGARAAYSIHITP
jgi:galactokinase